MWVYMCVNIVYVQCLMILYLSSSYSKTLAGHIWYFPFFVHVIFERCEVFVEGMGDVGSARYEPVLLPPCPTIRVLSYSN